MRRLLSYVILCALPLLFSCGKAPEAPVQFKATSLWQKTQWDLCSQELQKYLDPYVRVNEMRTLDAAYLAILTAPETDEESYVIPFSSGGTPSEARIERSGNKATVTVYRDGTQVGVFTQDESIFTGESTGIRFTATPLSVNSTEVHADITLSSQGVTLATLKADGPMDLVQVSVALPEGISLSGNVELNRLWDILRAIADEDSQEKVTPLVGEAASAIHVDVFYEGDVTTPQARVSMRPLHLHSRYDDYWTWDPIILTNEGDVLDDAWNALGGLDDTTASFVQAWQHILPHILS